MGQKNDCMNTAAEPKHVLNNVRSTIPALVEYIKLKNPFTAVYVKTILKENGADIITLSTESSYVLDENDHFIQRYVHYKRLMVKYSSNFNFALSNLLSVIE